MTSLADVKTALRFVEFYEEQGYRLVRASDPDEDVESAIGAADGLTLISLSMDTPAEQTRELRGLILEWLESVETNGAEVAS